jgi:hypothetical protein
VPDSRSALTVASISAARRSFVQCGASSAACYDGAPRDYLTPLQYAIMFDKDEILRFFVEECGEPVGQLTLNSRTTVDLAAKSPRVAAYLRSLEVQVTVVGAIATPDGAPREVSSRRSCTPL